MIPAGRAVSFEREVFPALVGEGLYGYTADGYWIDIGTPERYLESTWDLLAGRVAQSTLPPRDETGSLRRTRTASRRARTWGRRACWGATARSATGRARGALGAARQRATWAPSATIVESVLAERARVGDAGAGRARGAMVGAGAVVEPGAVVERGARVEPAGDACRRLIADGRGDRAVDPRGMLGDVLAQPLQLGDALWRSRPPASAPRDTAGGLVVCGMGGSAVGGDLAAAALGDRATRPITVGPRLRRSSRGLRPTRSSCARATRATPRRRSPASRRGRGRRPAGRAHDGRQARRAARARRACR